jgi:hypothetical protein
MAEWASSRLRLTAFGVTFVVVTLVCRCVGWRGQRSQFGRCAFLQVAEGVWGYREAVLAGNGALACITHSVYLVRMFSLRSAAAWPHNEGDIVTAGGAHAESLPLIPSSPALRVPRMLLETCGVGYYLDTPTTCSLCPDST